VIGLSVLYYSTIHVVPDKVDVSDIESSMVGEKVRVEGEIRNYSHFDGNSFFELEDEEESIKIAVFDSEGGHSEEEMVEVRGEVTIYEGDLEVIGDEVKSFNGSS
jgi:RecJ-like exonuclease